MLIPDSAQGSFQDYTECSLPDCKTKKITPEMGYVEIWEGGKVLHYHAHCYAQLQSMRDKLAFS